MPLPRTSKFTGLPARSSIRATSARGEDMHLLIVEFGDVLDQAVDTRQQLLPLRIGQHVGLDDADIDAAQHQDIGDVLQRALADDRQHPQRVAIVQHCGQVGGDAGIGAVRPAGDDADRCRNWPGWPARSARA